MLTSLKDKLFEYLEDKSYNIFSKRNNLPKIKILQESIKYLVILVVFVVIYLFYFLSLEECTEGLENCSLQLNLDCIENKRRNNFLCIIGNNAAINIFENNIKKKFNSYSHYFNYIYFI